MADLASRETNSPLHGRWPDGVGHGHFVQFYDRDSFLLDGVSRFVGTALGSGGSALVIATDDHRRGIRRRLKAHGLDLDAVSVQRRYLALDAAEALSRFMIDGWPEPRRFEEFVGETVERVSTKGGRASLAAFGEMVALLCAEGRHGAAIRLEQLWNELGKKLSFSLLCAYPIAEFGAKEHGDTFAGICAEHDHVIPAESYTELKTRGERLRAVSLLQQKASALANETAERAAAEKSLDTHRAELADFLESALEGLQRVGSDRKILWANRALLELLGYRADEYIGHDAAEFHADAGVFAEYWLRLMRQEALYDYPARLRCKDGSLKDVLIHSNGLWEHGRFLYSRCFIRDVTEPRRLQVELEARLAQLAEGDRRKDEFLAMLGHELRNPLAAVQNAVATARLDSVRRERALDIAQRQMNQLTRLVDDLLDVARITQGRIRLHRRSVSVASMLERVLESTRAAIEERSHTVTLMLREDVLVDADPTRLEQIVVNLVCNAVKYTEPGGTIEIACERSGDEAVLRVRDDGIGIAPHMLGHVFDLFTQAERTLDRAQGGLGIGLTLVRRLTELHGGRVEARSEGLGKGAEFVVYVPAAAAADPSLDGPRAPAQHATARVLLVEDNPDAAETLRMLLELLGHRVNVVHDGLSALAAAESNLPDVMLIDIGLPGMDGYELARQVRCKPALASVMLIALTGYGRDEDRDRATSVGFNYHLVKPVELDVLRSLVARADRRRLTVH